MKVFDLLVWSIVTIAIILVVINFYGNLNNDEPIETKINNKLDEALLPINMGKLLLVGNLELKKDYILSRTYFDTIKKSLVIECSSESLCCPNGEECPKIIEWTPENLTLKNTNNTKIFVRCFEINNFPACKIYVGKAPAQAKIKEIKLINQIDTSATFEIIVTNTGEATLFFGKTNFELYSNINGNFEKIDLELPTQELANLPVNTQHTFIWTIDTYLPGEYMAKFLFEGENAGFDFNTFDFNTTFNTNCQIDKEKEETKYITDEDLITQGVYAKHYYYCKNCNAAWECLAVWKKEFPDANFNIENKERVSCYSQSPGISCITYN